MSDSLFFCRFFRRRILQLLARARYLYLTDWYTIGSVLSSRGSARDPLRSAPLRSVPLRVPRLMIEEVVDIGDYARSNE